MKTFLTFSFTSELLDFAVFVKLLRCGSRRGCLHRILQYSTQLLPHAAQILASVSFIQYHQAHLITTRSCYVCSKRKSTSDVFLPSLFGLLCTAVLIGWDPAPPPPPKKKWAPIRGRYCLLVNQDRRHLFVTPFWPRPKTFNLTVVCEFRHNYRAVIVTQIGTVYYNYLVKPIGTTTVS